MAQCSFTLSGFPPNCTKTSSQIDARSDSIKFFFEQAYWSGRVRRYYENYRVRNCRLIKEVQEKIKDAEIRRSGSAVLCINSVARYGLINFRPDAVNGETEESLLKHLATLKVATCAQNILGIFILIHT